MITFPTKFQEYLDRSNSEPAIIVKLGDGVIEDEQTTETDWGNNGGESNVDYSTEGGSVILAADTIPEEDNNYGTGDAKIVENTTTKLAYDTVVYTNRSQSFEHSYGNSKLLDTVTIYVKASGAYVGATIKCYIRDSASSRISTIKTITVSNTSYAAKELDWSAEELEIIADTSYSIYVYSDDPHTGSAGYISWKANASPVNLAHKFTLAGDYFETSGSITTQVMDLGETPTDAGEYVFEDLTPSVFGTTAVEYHAFGSTDNFAASNVDLGVVADGDAISAGSGYRYYKIMASLSTTDKNETPTVQSINVRFFSYKKFSNKAIYDCEPSLHNVSSLTTKIDDFDLTTVGQITLEFGLTELLLSFAPKNKPAVILLGFVGSDFAESDFVTYYKGQIDDYEISPDYIFSFTVKDASKSWKVDVPRDETGSSGKYGAGTYTDITASGDHPVDVILDILRNHINVRDSFIDEGSFADVKALASISDWTVTRTITGANQESADTLINELRVMMGCYFIPQASGKIKLKKYDSSETAQATLTDDDFISGITYKGNTDAFYNKTFIKFDWNTGTEEYDHVYIGLDATSISKYLETKTFEFEDKWTLDADDDQVSDLSDNILDRYADPPSILDIELDYKHMGLEVADIVSINTYRFDDMPDIGLVTNYQIINKNLDPSNFKVRLTLLQVM